MSAPVREQQAGRRPDESMTLLTSMMQRPLDPGYAAAAERREARGLSPATPLRTWRVFVIALLVGTLVTTGALALRERSTAATRDRADLVRQIEARQASADARATTVRTLQAQVAEAQARALQQDDSQAASRLTRLETTAGASAVEGPGFVVTLDDGKGEDTGSADGNPRTGSDSDSRVQSRDVQIVVNALWEAGAEAIAVNGQRLSSTSAIRFAGEAILVNYRPLVRPYRIEAVAGPELESAFAAGSGGAYLQALRNNYGISSSVERDTSLTLPGASLAVRVARVPESVAATSTSRPTTPPATSSTPSTTTTTEAPR